METISISIGIVGLLVTIIPIILEFDRIVEKFIQLTSKQDLLGESIFIIYDIYSKERIVNYQTAKYKIKKNDSILILEHSSEYGKSEELTTKINNEKVKKEYLHISQKTRQLTYKLYDKNIGDTIVVDDCSTFVLEPDNDENEDSLGVIISPYRYKNLTIQLIFPKNFIPYNLRFEELIYRNGKKIIKNKSNIPKLMVNYTNDRKLLQWSIKYPTYKHHYRIGWTWKE